MKRKHASLITLLLIALSLSLTFFACSKNKVIVEIDGNKLTLRDFLYDIYIIEQERERWNSKYKESLGTDYWDYEFDGISMRQLSKNTIITRVVFYELLSQQAQKEGYTLTNNELALEDADVDKLFASMSEDYISKAGINRDIIARAHHKIALCNKYYLDIISNYEVNEELIRNSIDSDEYREYITECLYVPTVEVTEQEIIPYKDNKLDDSYDKIQDIKRRIHNGDDFDAIIDQVDGIIHYNRSFTLNDNTAEEEYKEAVGELANDEYSDVVTTKFGYYIIHMLDNASPIRYEEAIEAAIIEEKKARFMTYYDELRKDYKIIINSEYRDLLDLGAIQE